MKSATLVCVVTGREKKFYSLSLKNKCKKWGSLDEYRKMYVCREAIKLLKAKIPPDEVQKKFLPRSKKPFEIDLHVLARLKLLKKPKKDDKKSVNLDRAPIKWKVADVIKRGNNFATEQAYIEWLTAGPNKCQLSQGGTCWYTELRLDNNGWCDACPFVKYCLCRLRKVRKS